MSRVDAYEKGLQLYHVEHGRFPDYDGDGATCIGRISDYPAKDGYPEGVCMYQTVNGVASNHQYVSENIVDELSSVMSSMPSGKVRETVSTYTSGGSESRFYYRGLYYEHQNNPPGSVYPDWAYIEYMFKGQGACPKKYTTSYSQENNATFCSRVINAADAGID